MTKRVEPLKATITVRESVTLDAPGRRTEPGLYVSHYTGAPLTLADVEEFVRVVRRELRPELVMIVADGLQIVASQKVVGEQS